MFQAKYEKKKKGKSSATITKQSPCLFLEVSMQPLLTNETNVVQVQACLFAMPLSAYVWKSFRRLMSCYPEQIIMCKKKKSNVIKLHVR